MFEIEYGSDGEVICTGRLDAAQCEKAEAFIAQMADEQSAAFYSRRTWNMRSKFGEPPPLSEANVP